MGLEILTLGSSKTYTNMVALGLASATIDDVNKSITFTLASDGSQHTIHFNQPSDGQDGISITGVNNLGNGTFTLLFSDGSESDPIQTIKGQKGDKGDKLTFNDLTDEEKASLKGSDGFSPSAKIEKVGDTATITITDKDGTTTATIKDGQGGSGGTIDAPINSISVNGVNVLPDENKNVDITVPEAYDDTELLDIRVKADGTTATSAGNAVREQVNELKSDIEQKLDKPKTAQVGQIFRVQSITEDGNFVLEAVDMPSGGDVTDVQIDDSVASPKKTWSSQKISNELEECVKFVKITVNLVGSEGNIPLGNTVYVYEIVNEIETLSYSVLCPNGTISVRIPHGIQYRITASTDAEGFYAPTEVSGVAINDSEATIRYTELTYPKTIRDLQTLAQMGLAGDVVAIGDEFTTTYTYDGNEFEMPWIVTDIKEVEFEDGSTGQGVYLEAKYCTIESIQFDAPHREVATEETAIEGLYYIGMTDSTCTLLTLNTGDTIPYSDYTYVYHDTIRDTSLNIYRYGHNRVQTSALRQWLNSDADKGQWWKAPKVGYCKPSQLNTQKGFMAGLPKEFIDCVAKVKRTYYTNSVTDGSVIDVLYDKFFSATGTELYGSVNDNEGTYFPYYKEVTGLSAPSNSQNTGRIKYALNAKTSSQYCWAFSSSRGISCSVWYRSTTGQLHISSATSSYRAVPACVIG